MVTVVKIKDKTSPIVLHLIQINDCQILANY